MAIQLLLFVLVFSCSKISVGAYKNKFSYDQVNDIFAKRNYCSKDTFFTIIEQSELEEALSEVADLVEHEDSLLKKLIETEISNGHNFFHFLFSSRGGGQGSGFRRIFDKCFPDKKIPDQVFEKITALEEFNILHFCIWEGDLDVALEVLLNNENSRILDRGDLVGNTPLFSLFDSCINFNLQEKCDYVQLTRVIAVFDQMLFRGFDVNRRNEDGMNFLGNTVDNLNHLSVDEEKMKVGVNYVEMVVKVISLIANSPSTKPHWLPVRKALAEYEHGRKIELKAKYENRIAEAASGKFGPEERRGLTAEEIGKAAIKEVINVGRLHTSLNRIENPTKTSILSSSAAASAPVNGRGCHADSDEEEAEKSMLKALAANREIQSFVNAYLKYSVQSALRQNMGKENRDAVALLTEVLIKGILDCQLADVVSNILKIEDEKLVGAIRRFVRSEILVRFMKEVTKNLKDEGMQTISMRNIERMILANISAANVAINASSVVLGGSRLDARQDTIVPYKMKMLQEQFGNVLKSGLKGRASDIADELSQLFEESALYLQEAKKRKGLWNDASALDLVANETATYIHRISSSRSKEWRQDALVCAATLNLFLSMQSGEEPIAPMEDVPCAIAQFMYKVEKAISSLEKLIDEEAIAKDMGSNPSISRIRESIV